MEVLSRFHPLISRWFLEEIGEPTDIQRQSWEQISGNRHVLITAPTGSGKTLAAFLWAINMLVTGQLPAGCTGILYVSPLKALNNDIQRNLIRPLKEIREMFEQAGLNFPEIRVLTRSGDTAQSERARMQRHPPEILITTPESLNLLLSSAGGRMMLKNLATVILDEIHAVLGTKRGVYLMTAVERLVPLSGEFQRIVLSATIKSLDPAARFAGGFRIEGDPKQPVYVPREVATISTPGARRYNLRVSYPEPEIGGERDTIWTPLTASLKEIIKRNNSTLVFANSRRLCEKLALNINEEEEQPIAYVHHGSLSREIRNEVEKRLREGELKAVIATNSLELGIDIGVLDEVVLVQSPNSISSAIQRVGRAGHRVGQTCRGTIFPTHPHDLLEAAVLSPAITRQDMETVKPINRPLDVLAQVIVSMTSVEKWDIDDLYRQVTASFAYRDLSREQFDLVLKMLAGRYADSQIRELRPQVSIDRLDNTVVAKKGALLAIYTSGGVIPDRGYFHLRHRDSRALIGELDEEFVWESEAGKTFSLGAQNWRIERITHNDVFVLPGSPGAMAAPFWRGEDNYRDFHFSELIGRFLELANARLEDPDLADLLERENNMDRAAAEELIAYLKRQKDSTGSDLPHRHHVLVEAVSSGPGGAPGNQLVLHTIWGNRVNRPLSMALEAAWEERSGQRLEIYTSNDCIVFQLPPEMQSGEVLSLVSSNRVESLLRRRLEKSGFFGARFRECAGRALLLPRSRMGERMPLWMNRLRSQKLLNAVSGYEDFPILLEAWRSCLADEFDLVSLKQVLAELESGVIHWSEAHTAAMSPMAQHIVWRQTNDYMYMGDEPAAGTASRLRDDLLQHVVFTPSIRPTVNRELVEQFERKRRRLAPGYSPEDPRELVDWVKERLLIPAAEWEDLLRAIYRDHGISKEKTLESVSGRLTRILPPEASEPLIAAIEDLPRISYGLYSNTDIITQPLMPDSEVPSYDRGTTAIQDGDSDEMFVTILGEWLQFYGPIGFTSISNTLGISLADLILVLEDLVESQKAITGQLVTGAGGEQVCDSENYEILLRMARRAAVPAIEAKDIKLLPQFLAQYQGIGEEGGDVDRLFHLLEQVRCLPEATELWESEILPARLSSYSGNWLDTVMQEGDLRWVGGEKRTAAFCFEAELPLLKDDIAGQAGEDIPPDPARKQAGIFPDAMGRYNFSNLLTVTGYRPDELSDRLWEGVWRGRISNDSYAALRKGIMNNFKAPEIVRPSRPHSRYSGRHSGRISFSMWKSTLPFAGNWFLLPPSQPADDLLESEERMKDRVRILLDRYGILFRELLERESVLFRWGKIFRALRLMELSGEVLSGYFFRDIPGPQFMSPQALQVLQSRLSERIYWLNACDPASLCGVQIEEIKHELPKRIEGNHLVYHGSRLVVISQRNGRTLHINVTAEDGHLPEYLGFLRHLLTRQFQPLRRIIIETINGEKAVQSPYVAVLKSGFDALNEGEYVTLYRKTGTVNT
ncbi:MAG: DEAD/DEAH box helicase [Dehalococcoidales bacterium]|nr:DEAD/DEAH box helicase [Dehalococcoidales bacterium]